MHKRPTKKVRSLIRKELGCLNRDLRYLEKYMHEGYALPSKYTDCYLTILKLYDQQKYMYDHKTHRVENRMVSISQPYIRPIVRGKAKSPVEFGAKYDVSIDEKGHARLEKIQFDPYNESTILQDVIERYNERNGHYPARVLVDQIYRTTLTFGYSNVGICDKSACNTYRKYFFCCIYLTLEILRSLSNSLFWMMKRLDS